MGADALLAEIMRRSDFIFAGWNVLLLGGIALLAAIGLLPALRADRRTARALMAAFAFFAVTHLLGMLHVTKQWASLTEALKHKLAADPTLAEKLDFAVMAPHLSWIVPFHLAFDVFVIAAVWWLTRPRPE
ncbi:MAG TPA: hypothetical protein VM533_06005 [Fimbriiglobus sp.]|nr:hypothetical protein [Fimbriiglobus sp.]